jgi:DNA-binding MarR family transcriptional regulator
MSKKGNLEKIEDCTECVCFNLRMATRAITQVYDRAMQPTGLRATQFPILAVLAMGGPSTITNLSQFLVMDRTTLARNLKPLEKRGFISIAKGNDRRTKTVTLTEQGADAISDALPRWEKAQKMVVEKMGENRWQTTLESLRALPSLFPLDSTAAPAASKAKQ